MRQRAPGARAIGVAVLEGHRFVIGRDGWASVEPARGQCVYGVLWKITPRDQSALHAYELLGKGLYKIRHLPVRFGGRMVRAMTYMLRSRAKGRPKPGYIAMITAAARHWKLPERHVRAIESWSRSRWVGVRFAQEGK